MEDPENGRDPSIKFALEYLRARTSFHPTVVLVLGSGLGRVAERCTTGLALAYSEIPGFPTCSVYGHAGRLTLGTWQGVPLAILEGRAHRYEGHSLEVVTRPIRTLAALGARILITTCAAGALHEAKPGTLFLIDDHMNLMGDTPLLTIRGVPADSSCFLEMADAYDRELRAAAAAAASQAGIPLERGVLACVMGPTYETGAEAEMLRRLGAHAVNMSVVPEVIAARASKQRVLGLAVLTNRAGVLMRESAGHEEVLAIAEASCKPMSRILDTVFQQLSA